MITEYKQKKENEMKVSNSRVLCSPKAKFSPNSRLSSLFFLDFNFRPNSRIALTLYRVFWLYSWPMWDLSLNILPSHPRMIIWCVKFCGNIHLQGGPSFGMDRL